VDFEFKLHFMTIAKIDIVNKANSAMHQNEHKRPRDPINGTELYLVYQAWFKQEYGAQLMKQSSQKISNGLRTNKIITRRKIRAHLSPGNTTCITKSSRPIRPPTHVRCSNLSDATSQASDSPNINIAQHNQ
jgi:hypothetical protein